MSALCHPRASLGFKTFFANLPLSVHKIPIDCCSCFALALLLLCSCACSCCHDPFIVRSASNLFIVPRFHSVCASFSMFTINDDNCLFPFLGMFLFLSSTRVSVQISRPFSVHRSRPLCVHTRSVYVHTESADSAPDPIIGLLPPSCSGVWGPWPVEYQACDMNNIVVQKQRLALLQHLRNFFSFLMLTSSSRTCSCIQKVSRLFVFPSLSCFPVDPSQNSPFLQHSQAARCVKAS